MMHLRESLFQRTDQGDPAVAILYHLESLACAPAALQEKGYKPMSPSHTIERSVPLLHTARQGQDVVHT